MEFLELPLPGAFLIDLAPREDGRGFFARAFSDAEFGGRGLVKHFAEASLSFNKRRGTVRGMHFQRGRHAETKLVRCIAGSAFDIIVDLRESPTYLKSHGVELSAENRRALYIPIGMGHGFQTLRDGTELLYMIDVPYNQESAGGVRWNDPAVGITWPGTISVISERDLEFPDWVV